MIRKAMIDELGKAGFDVALLPDIVPTPTIAEICRVVSGLQSQMKTVNKAATEAQQQVDDAKHEREQVAEVQAHVERFSEDFERIGRTSADIVVGFKAARKADPTLTAAAFLNRR